MEKVGIVAFAFGTPADISSNKKIAREAAQKASQWKCPLYTQADIKVPEGSAVKPVYTEEQSGNPPPTLRICRAAVKWAVEQGIGTLWIKAAEPHVDRCLRDLEYAIREAKTSIAVRVFKFEDYPEDFWFCQESTQKRTRTEKDWWGRERVLRLMPMFIYKRVAG